MKKLLLAVAVASLLSACASNVKKDEPAPVTNATTSSTDSKTNTGATTSAGIVVPGVDPNATAWKNQPVQRSVYFDYDKDTVRADAKPVIEANAAFINKNNVRKVTIQGNTDERGSREYNLALGQRRADTVRKNLSVLGVQDSVIETISFGEEKPKSLGANEAAFTENRRADIVYGE